jgi:hypothetical protein
MRTSFFQDCLFFVFLHKTRKNRLLGSLWAIINYQTSMLLYITFHTLWEYYSWCWRNCQINNTHPR